MTNRVPTWEEHLIHRAQSGEAVAMEILIDMHRTAIRSHALRMLRSVEDAEDALQETFVKAFRAMKGFDSSRPLLPWLMRICTNCSVDIIRGRHTQNQSIDEFEYAIGDGERSMDDSLIHRLQYEKLEKAIQRLPDRYREIIMMRHFRHMDVAEIARELDAPEGTVKSWLFRARDLMRRELLEQGEVV